MASHISPVVEVYFRCSNNKQCFVVVVVVRIKLTVFRESKKPAARVHNIAPTLRASFFGTFLQTRRPPKGLGRNKTVEVT